MAVSDGRQCRQSDRSDAGVGLQRQCCHAAIVVPSRMRCSATGISSCWATEQLWFCSVSESPGWSAWGYIAAPDGELAVSRVMRLCVPDTSAAPQRWRYQQPALSAAAPSLYGSRIEARLPESSSYPTPPKRSCRPDPGWRSQRGSSPRIAAHHGSILAGPHCLALRSCYAYRHVRCSSNPQRAVLPHVVPAPIEQVVLDKRQVSNS